MSRKHNLKLLAVVFMVFSGATLAPQALALSDHAIKQWIEDKAAGILHPRETKVRVAVEDGYVVLYGTVGLYIQKMLYEQIAWKTVGVTEVDNEIRVVPKLPQADADIKRKIMEFVQSHHRLQGVNLKVAVEGGTVRIRAVFDHPRDVLFLKRRVAEIEGVIAIEIQATLIT